MCGKNIHLVKVTKMGSNTKVADVLTEINSIYANYCSDKTTQEDLVHWINNCLKLTITGELETRQSFKYEECHIEYFKQLLLFSIVKSESDNDGYPTGITYDIAISIKPYLMMFFGTENVDVLRDAVQLLDEDLNEISAKLYEDIDLWGQNVAAVFNRLSVIN